jgi:hypothetical protein
MYVVIAVTVSQKLEAEIAIWGQGQVVELPTPLPVFLQVFISRQLQPRKCKRSLRLSRNTFALASGHIGVR